MRALIRKRGLPRDARDYVLAAPVDGESDSQRTAYHTTHCACENRSVEKGLFWRLAKGGIDARTYWFIESKTGSIKEYLKCEKKSGGEHSRRGLEFRCKLGEDLPDSRMRERDRAVCLLFPHFAMSCAVHRTQTYTRAYPHLWRVRPGAAAAFWPLLRCE
jgi:hypothetical protein